MKEPPESEPRKVFDKGGFRSWIVLSSQPMPLHRVRQILQIIKTPIVPLYVSTEEIVPSITDPTASFASRKSWTQLIQKIYEADPLTWPKCQGWMCVIAFIEDNDVIRKILVHLGQWDARNHDLPSPGSDAFHDFIIDEHYF